MKDLEQKFTERWPEFFRDVYCGFWLPEKWETLVWTLCEQIEWRLKCNKETNDMLKVAQVKEKFGGLRFYYDYDGKANDAVDGAVDLAESLSYAPEYALERPKG